MWYGQGTRQQQSGSTASHRGQQFPGVAPDLVISQSVRHATTPTKLEIVDRADYIWVKTAQNNLKFYFGEDTAGTGTFATDQGINFGTPAAVGSINIQPTGWTGDGGTTGDVIFIYNSKRK